MPSIPETSLSSPLLEAPYKQFLDAFSGTNKNPKTETERLAASFRSIFPALPLKSIVRHTPEMTPELSRLGSKVNLPSFDITSTKLSGSSDFLDAYCTSLKEGLKTLGPSMPSPIFRSLFPLSPFLVNSCQDAFFWQNLVESCVASSGGSDWQLCSTHYCSRRFVLLAHGGNYVVLTYDVALMFKDMMYSRFIVHVLSELDPDRRQLTNHMNKFLDICDNMLREYGNEAYELIKSIEALCKVQIVLRHETWLDGAGQAAEMVNKYVKKEVKLGGDGKGIRQIWNMLCALPDTQAVSEVFGLTKLSGHPYVDPRRGCRKVQDIVHSEQDRDLETCRSLGYSFCHMYTRGYLSKTGRWPPLLFRRPASGRATKLERLYNKNHPSLAFGFSQYSANEWDYAVFKPHIKYDYGDDILKLMSDKALSHPRTCFDSVWNGKLDYRPPRPEGSKRVLERLLSKDDLNMFDVTHRVQARDIPFEWKIVSICPKEREMKLEPRMFSKMVLEMRSFFVLAEDNIKSGVFSYIKEQTMNLNRQELISRFLSVTADRGRRWVKLFIEIDFSSWNLHFDEYNTDPIGIRLNEIYGTENLFTTIHRFFRECIIVMDNGDCPPLGLSESTRDAVMNGEMFLDTIWGNHACGFEGIAQKLWTLATIAIGHQAVKDLGVPFVQNGQADNQVYAFDVYVPDSVEERDVQAYVRELETNVLTRLNRTAERVGHEIKPEECICSTCYFSYGKEMYVNGQYTTTLGKALSRIFPATTADAPSTFELVSSVSGGGTAATEKSNVSVPCMQVTKFIEHLTVTRECTKSLLHRDKFLNHIASSSLGKSNIAKYLIDLLCVIPGNFGGLPISTCLEYLYRGHSDPTASSLMSLVLVSSFPGVREYLTLVDQGKLFKKDPEIHGLIQDPYALPIDTRPPASSRVARLVEPVLLELVTNKSLLMLKEVSDNDSRGVFTEWASSIRPLYPKVLHDLYKSSLLGVVDGLTKRFTNTRTLMHLTTAAGTDITQASINADFAYVICILEHVSRTLLIEPQTTHWNRASDQYFTLQRLRRAWNLGDFEGVTNLHPLAAGTLLWMPSDWNSLHRSNEIVVMSESSDSDCCRQSRGSVQPYMGTKTDDRTVGKWIKPINSSPPLRDVTKIITVQSMLSLPDSDLWKSLDCLAQSRTTLDLSVIRTLCRNKVGGTIAHRYQTRDDPKGSFVNVSTNWPSHLTISSNWAGQLGRDDYPFDFQECITCLQGLLSWVCNGSTVPAPFGLVLSVDLSRMASLTDQILTSKELILPARTINPSYYLVATSFTVSDRAMTSAVMSDVDQIPGLSEAPGDIICALTALLGEQASGRIQQGNKFGRVLGAISYKRLLDLSELKSLKYDEMVDAVARALILRVSFRVSSACHPDNRPAEDLYDKSINTELRRLTPSLYGTLREVTHGSARRGYGLGDPSSSKDLVSFMSDVRARCSPPIAQINTQIYLRGSASVSRGLFSQCSFVALRFILSSDEPDYRSCKSIVYMLKAIMNYQDELTRIRYLATLLEVLGENFSVTTVRESAEEVLRTLRTRPSAVVNDITLNYSTVLTFPPRLNRLDTPVNGAESAISLKPPNLTADTVLKSWQHQQLEEISSGYRWSPLRHTLPKNVQTVLVIGIGDGGICTAFDPTWSIVGVELGSVLAKLGQKMIDYTPPHAGTKFSLHPISWVLGGDITDRSVRSTLLEECTLRAYDLVIIDVDRVVPQTRLRIRQEFAQTGVLTYCRVLVHNNDRTQIEDSFSHYAEREDRLWWTHNYPDNEFIVGCSSAPLGILAPNTPTLVRHISSATLPCQDQTNESLPVASLQQCYLDLIGDFRSTDTPIHTSDCLSLRDYINDPHRTGREILFQLFATRCPRKRIRSYYTLLRLGLIVGKIL